MVIEIDIPTRFPKHQEPGLIQVGPLGYFIHISIIIPVEKLLHLDFLGFSRNSIGCFKPLLDPGGGFILLWSCRAVSEGKRPLHNHLYATAVLPSAFCATAGAPGYATAGAPGVVATEFIQPNSVTWNYVPTDYNYPELQTRLNIPESFFRQREYMFLPKAFYVLPTARPAKHRTS